ncbi:enoyl-CoA hydratase [Actinosynnema sp. ALI-1.44]|uniref:enoyl-CoA hydratase/isomerase family protein n=1 Tax=Actinosynnema sp. ALI-1.44 TaxID=1933779 RepID=UPI00097C50FF|nr:enoyl-CoA hydratase/isomerase family protein [Actinosynnema sp. ALI-1.44]ONI70724.1 enoyl-CoA hydratase [Actinosynnema sp. ALI-1.44]
MSVVVEQEGPVLTVTFNRPDKHNAMTFEMYESLAEACERADSDDGIRAMVLRGAGRQAFVSGTDITQFQQFETGADGLAYEQRIAEVLTRLEDVTVPTIAVIRGYCVGAGIAIAAVCDLRVAATSARFGVPIARTLGNCLSMNTYSLLVHHLGPSRAMDMLLRAKLLTGGDAKAAGFVHELCGDDDLARTATAVVGTVLRNSPLSMWAAKQAIARLRRAALPDGDDIVSRVFGSDDFHAAVAAFDTKRQVNWKGR